MKYYIFIRLYSPREEDGAEPFFVRREFIEGQGLTWDLTQEFGLCATFQSEDIAKRIVRSVGEFANRVNQGWAFEVVKVSEVVLDHNLGVQEEAA